jgi:antitoxin MazE
MIMNIHVKKWGNSASVRIPAAMMAAARLRIDDPVRVREQDGAIIIEPLLNPATANLIVVKLSGVRRGKDQGLGPTRW